MDRFQEPGFEVKSSYWESCRLLETINISHQIKQSCVIARFVFESFSGKTGLCLDIMNLDCEGRTQFPQHGLGRSENKSTEKEGLERRWR